MMTWCWILRVYITSAWYSSTEEWGSVRETRKAGPGVSGELKGQWERSYKVEDGQDAGGKDTRGHTWWLEFYHMYTHTLFRGRHLRVNLWTPHRPQAWIPCVHVHTQNNEKSQNLSHVLKPSTVSTRLAMDKDHPDQGTYSIRSTCPLLAAQLPDYLIITVFVLKKPLLYWECLKVQNCKITLGHKRPRCKTKQKKKSPQSSKSGLAVYTYNPSGSRVWGKKTPSSRPACIHTKTIKTKSTTNKTQTQIFRAGDVDSVMLHLPYIIRQMDKAFNDKV